MASVSILGAVASAISAGSLNPACSVWGVILPAKTSYPAVVVKYPRTEFDWTFEGASEYFEKPELSVHCYAAYGELAESVIRQILKLLTDAPLSLLVTGSTIQVFPRDLYLRDTAQRGPNGEEFVEAVLEIAVEVLRPRHPVNIQG